jgi:uncharacterized protein YbaP (TraB family)
MRRRDFLIAALAVTATPAFSAPPQRFDKGLLWRVTSKSGTASHIYGTIHVADARLGTLPAPVEEAFRRATSLMLEFVPDPYSRERFLVE